MKKIVVLVLGCGLLAAGLLLAPLGVFLYHLSSLELSDDLLYQQLGTLSLLSISEPSDTRAARPSQTHTVTVTVTDDALHAMIVDALNRAQSPFVKIGNVETAISPEMVYVAVSVRYEVAGFVIPYDLALSSEWLLRAAPTSLDTSAVELKPASIHTNYLTSINWADYWPQVSKTRSSDGWLRLPSVAELDIESLILQEHTIALSVSL